jgi:ketosteroid isomerase-like protein
VSYYTKLGELTGGSIKVDLHDVVANDEHVVGLHRTSAQRAGKSLETTSAIVFHVQGGRVSEAWEHPFDLYGLDEVFG